MNIMKVGTTPSHQSTVVQRLAMKLYTHEIQTNIPLAVYLLVLYVVLVDALQSAAYLLVLYVVLVDALQFSIHLVSLLQRCPKDVG